MDLGIVVQINKDLLKASSTDSINFSQREMFGMSLLYNVNTAEYVDLFEDEEYTKVVPCVLSV